MKIIKKPLAIILITIFMMSFVACGSSSKAVGTWIEDGTGDTIVVNKNGSYTFEYSEKKYVGEWKEQEGVLIFTDESSGWSSTGKLGDGSIEIYEDPGADGTIGKGTYKYTD